MGFLIPTARANPRLLARFGRLLHWTALGLACLMLLLACFAVSAFSAVPLGKPYQGPPMEVWLFFAAVFALAGRAGRYLFAGE